MIDVDTYTDVHVLAGGQYMEQPNARSGFTGAYSDAGNNSNLNIITHPFEFRDYKRHSMNNQIPNANAGMNNHNSNANAGFRTISNGMEYRTGAGNGNGNVDARSGMNGNYQDEGGLNRAPADMMRSSMGHVDRRGGAGAINSNYMPGMTPTDVRTVSNGTGYASGTNGNVGMRQGGGGHADMQSQTSAQNGELSSGGGNMRPQASAQNGDMPSGGGNIQHQNQEPGFSNYIPGPPIRRLSNADPNVAPLPSGGSFKMQAQSPQASSPASSLYSSMDRDPRMYSTVENSNSNRVTVSKEAQSQ
jgi:hypothetical protein